MIISGLEIKQHREKLGLTQKELADLIGASRETIINYEKGRPIPKSKSEILHKVLEPDGVYHLSVAHNNVKPLSEDFENKNGNKFIELPNGQYYMLMPLAEFKIQAGFLSSYQDTDFLMDLGQHGILVDKPLQGRYVAFRVNGDSMDDGSNHAITRNSIVSTRELQRHHWTDKLRYRDFPYWVIYTTQSKMPLLKEIVEHNTEEGYIMCHSLNDSPEFTDFKLHLNDVQALFYVIDVSRSVSKKISY
ncbi:helix-turn-helix transcriptional regulator [Flavobacterium salilacus subsp. salilacus]|uniref:helix-turn-helix transcriptional regulator n=1 Tax=Flavobacterium TaxID=237 RepID=UPI0010751F56|nr:MULTISPECIES: helix-turn-helix transcriptional regulator [Flavobacterium]KAF2518279.1 helix-turn-helix transcriptional regulator [Flavobacterium salilacus subsp. salilacus]MBE1615309.1 helix-turn-helix transcriptional regulator [Flavobacterium sp. SaA2.13]